VLSRKFLKNKYLAFTLLLIKNVIPGVSGPEMSLIISRVDSRKPFIKSPVDSGEIFYEAEWILANLLSKAQWILAKSFTKPSGFPANFHKPNR